MITDRIRQSSVTCNRPFSMYFFPWLLSREFAFSDHKLCKKLYICMWMHILKTTFEKNSSLGYYPHGLKWENIYKLKRSINHNKICNIAQVFFLIKIYNYILRVFCYSVRVKEKTLKCECAMAYCSMTLYQQGALALFPLSTGVWEHVHPENFEIKKP